MDAQPLAGKRAIVTGGNTGIGAATVRALAKAGAHVMINYIEEEEAATALASEIADGGGEARTFRADISDAKAVEAMFGALDEAWGGVDILVNNAAIEGERVLTWESDPAAWRQVFDVNVFGSFLCSKEALKRMVPAKAGVVVVITSVHEVIPWLGYSAYTTSKAALSMLVKTMAQEAAASGVRVVAIAPGAIKTDINEKIWKEPAGVADLREKIPARRMGRPEEVAEVVTFVASDQASYITGSTIYVDGGMVLYPSFMHGG